MTPGIHPSMPFDRYRAIDAVNWSSLKHMAESPRHYRFALDNPKPSTAAQQAGQLFHAALLEPDRFARHYLCLPDKHPRRPTDAQWCAAKPSPQSVAAMEWWRSWELQAAGRDVIERDARDQALAMASAVRTDPTAGRYLDGAQTELTLVWIDPMSGLLCKGRIDIYGRVDGRYLISDPKGCVSADARRFGSEANRMLYHCQLAHYMSGAQALGLPVDDCALIACEIGGAHDVGVFVAGEDTMAIAHERRDALLLQLAECRAANRWPGRYDSEQLLQLPAYLFSDSGDDAESLGITFKQAA